MPYFKRMHIFIFLYFFSTIYANPTKQSDYDYLNDLLDQEGQVKNGEYYYDYYDEPFDSTKYEQEIYLDRKLKVECETNLNIDNMVRIFSY